MKILVTPAQILSEVYPAKAGSRQKRIVRGKLAELTSGGQNV